jgi:hypothetical protein
MKLFEEMALGLDFGAQRGVGRGLLTILFELTVSGVLA